MTAFFLCACMTFCCVYWARVLIFLFLGGHWAYLTSILPLAPFSLNYLLNGLYHTPPYMNVEGCTQFRAWHLPFPRVILWGEPVTSSCGFSSPVCMLYQPVCWNHEVFHLPVVLAFGEGVKGEWRIVFLPWLAYLGENSALMCKNPVLSRVSSV